MPGWNCGSHASAALVDSGYGTPWWGLSLWLSCSAIPCGPAASRIRNGGLRISSISTSHPSVLGRRAGPGAGREGSSRCSWPASQLVAPEAHLGPHQSGVRWKVRIRCRAGQRLAGRVASRAVVQATLRQASTPRGGRLAGLGGVLVDDSPPSEGSTAQTIAIVTNNSMIRRYTFGETNTLTIKNFVLFQSAQRVA